MVRLDGEVRLHDFVPEAIAASLEAVKLEERTPPVAETDLSAWIDDAIHHADARTLTVVWVAEGPAPLGTWTLRYLDCVLGRGEGTSPTPTVFGSFELASSSAELELETGGSRWTIPIWVADLALLPTGPGLANLGLRELLALLGRRVGGERLALLRTQRGAPGVASVLDAARRRLRPHGCLQGLVGPARGPLSGRPTVGALPPSPSRRERGARRLARPVRGADDQLSRDELWVYGCELLRELKRVDLAAGPDQPTRAALLEEQVASIRDDLPQPRAAAIRRGVDWCRASVLRRDGAAVIAIARGCARSCGSTDALAPHRAAPARCRAPGRHGAIRN